jgi:multisubunit Na+/H+ antiporter MnhE subunit
VKARYDDDKDFTLGKALAGKVIGIVLSYVTRRHEMSRFAHLRKVRKREK